MQRKLMFGAALAAATGIAGPVFAGAADYAFEPVKAEVKEGDGSEIAVRLIHKPSGKPVPDAVIFVRRMDMAPDGMPTMTANLEPLPATEPGLYRFKTNLPMRGRWQLSLAAKIQGETETLQNRIMLRVTE